jgi:cytochrome P450
MDHFLSTKARQSAFDAVWDFAIPLPRDFMARLLGLSMAEKERIEEVLSANRTDMNSALAPVGEVLSGIFQEIKKTPRDGLCSDLLHAPQEQALDEEAILSTVRHLWFAGTVTLTGLLPAAVLELCKSPPLREQLAENQEKIPAFISEVLRLEPPAQFVPRMAARDIEIEGMHIPPNAMVRLFLAAANRDPAEFQNPNEIDLDRIPYRHLAFGSGEHFCLGALIAKTISNVSIRRIATELPRLRRGDASELCYEKGPTFRALATLPVLAS